MLKENIGAGTVVEIKESAVIDATYWMGLQPDIYNADLFVILPDIQKWY